MSFGGISSFKAFKLYFDFFFPISEGARQGPQHILPPSPAIWMEAEGDPLGQDPRGELVSGAHGKGWREHTGLGFCRKPLPSNTGINRLRTARLPGGPGNNGNILRISKAGKNQSSNPKKVL